jgi:hypothetical protein
MSRRGGRGRRRRRRYAEEQRVEGWARWRQQADRVAEDREAEAFEREFEDLGRMQGRRVRSGVESTF